MVNTKTYQLVINGLKESIDAVESLNRQLADVEQRIKAIDGKTININVNNVGGTTGGDTTGGGSRTSELSEQDKLQRQLIRNEEKIQAMQTEEYKALLMQKEVIKEINTEQKANIASDNLSAKEYSNTMAELKQHLKDIKAAMQTEEIGSDRFKQLAQEANELNNKLKEIEASYGQFGRNVGNYGSAAEGFKGISVEVNGIDRSFKSLSSATKTLRGELGALELNEKGNTEEADRLRERIKELESAMHHAKDASYAMGRAMDWMQSFVAMASVGKGISAMFGIDSSNVEESMRKLLALQNTLKGIEKLQKQIATSDGIGKWLSKSNVIIDKFVNNLFGLSKASNTATKSLEAQAVATKTVDKANKAAAIGAKILSTALKTIPFLAVITGVTWLLDNLGSVIDWIKGVDEETKRLEEQQKKLGESTAEAYSTGNAEIQKHLMMVNSFNGTVEEEKRMVDELNGSLGKTFGNYQSIAEWKQVLIDSSDAYLEMMRREAQAQVYLESYKEAMKAAAESADDAEKVAKAMETANNEMEKYLATLRIVTSIQNRFFRENTSGFTGTSGSGVDNVKKAEENIQNMRIRVMRDGLAKTIAQYTLERNRRIDEVKKTGIRVGEQTLLIEREYQQRVLAARRQYEERLMQQQKQFEQTFMDISKNTSEQAYSNTLKRLETELKNNIEVLTKYPDAVNNIFDSEETQLEKYKAKITTLADSFQRFLKNPLVGVESNLEYGRISERKIYYENLLDIERTYLQEQKQIRAEQLTDELRAEEEANKKALEIITGNLEKVKRFGEEIYSENPIKKALDAYANMDISDKSLLDISDTLINEKDAVDEFINELESAYNLGLITYEQYEQTMQSEQLKNYNESKSNYEEFLDYYNEQNAEWQQDNADKLQRFELDTYEAFARMLQNMYSAQETYNNQSNVLTKKHNAEIASLNDEFRESEQRYTAEYYKNMLYEYEKADSAIENIVDKIRTRADNQFEFLDIKKIKYEFDSAAEEYGYRLKELSELKQKLFGELMLNNITFEEFDTINEQYDAEITEVKEKIDSIKVKFKEALDENKATFNDYMQLIGQSMQSIMTAIWDYQDSVYESEMKKLEDWVDFYEAKLSEQKSITEKYADAVNDIESELANSRGDRRQHLIDQLNAQIQAQRASLAEQKRIEKEKQKYEDEAKRKEEAQRKIDHRRALQTAIMNAALAISQAAANHWPLPAIPLIAAATAVGAAQVASIASQKYAEGGIIQGKSHKDGGVKVLGGTAEVEGGEFITNRITTSKNAPLLEYINSNKKKVELSDLIEFYNKKPRKNIMAMSAKFAEGGTLPVVDVSDQLNDIVIVQSQQPIYVTVKDIEDGMSRVSRVRVLAGLKE